MKASILIVEDDLRLACVLKEILTEEGYQVVTVESAEEGFKRIARNPPHLVISDHRLPGVSGLRLCEILRSKPATREIPLILLTVLGSLSDKVRGLKSGADDYITKPFETLELMARIEALLRRGAVTPFGGSSLRIKSLRVDADAKEVRLKGKTIFLRRKEYELLALFFQRPGRVLSKNFIIENIWDNDMVVTSNALNSQVKNLRQKLGPYKSMIETVIGVGYKLNSRFSES